jgi:hypothetical protein
MATPSAVLDGQAGNAGRDAELHIRRDIFRFIRVTGVEICVYR